MSLRYVSTRGAAATLGFADVLLTGLAPDGGLYVPEHWPTLSSAQLRSFAGRPYAEVALEVMWPYVEGEIDRDVFSAIVTASYAVFDHEAVVPLRDLGDDRWLAELFWGPTLAFKDVALQLVGRLFDHVLRERGRRVTIVAATSGDTGSAAIEACRDREAVDIVVLHPAGRVSEVQRRQMTTVLSNNVHNVAVDGTFDDCQDLVKALFADEEFREEVSLSAVNSINWARVMAQIVYYVTAAVQLGAPDRGITFCVPTGNFGNIFAGYAAQRMGVPVSQLVIASNANDLLTRFVQSGSMEIRSVEPSLSPSMDIQVSSNLERLLFELFGRDGGAIAELMTEFRIEGKVRIDADRLAPLREHFAAGRIDDAATLEVISRIYRENEILLDPHSAVGVGVADRLRSVAGTHGPIVCLATAHPAKFPDAVEVATGVRPPLPPSLADLFERPERYDTLDNDLDLLRAYVRHAVSKERVER